MKIILLTIFYLFFPMLILYLCQRYTFVNRIGSVILAYGFGLLLGNIGLLPGTGPDLSEYLLNNPNATTSDIEVLKESGIISTSDLFAYQVYKLRDLLMTITILLAIPLMLFSSNIKQWRHMAGKTLMSLLIGLFSVVLVVVVGFFIFSGKGMEELWKVAGMLIGVYTGGTPNLASLKMMLDVDAEIYILTHTYDLVIGVFYLAFLMTVGKTLFKRFLPKFPIDHHTTGNNTIRANGFYWGAFKRQTFIPLLKAYGVALLISATGGGLSLFVPDSMVMVVVILTITTLGILASMIPSINRIDKTFESGMYLILIFSLVVASMADVRNFGGLTPGLFAYITMAVFGSLFLHVLLSKVFKVDSDTTMITSVAFICSPPFVPVIAGAIGNRQVIVSGITIGIIGYALGNYLGVMVAYLLK